MENNKADLKDIRDRVQALDPRDDAFDARYEALSNEVLAALKQEGEEQERSWIAKGQEIITAAKTDPLIGSTDRDRALSYLQEAVDSAILKKDI